MDFKHEKCHFHVANIEVIISITFLYSTSPHWSYILAYTTSAASIGLTPFVSNLANAIDSLRLGL